MSSSTIKLAFIGLGAMGQTAHLRNYLTVPGVEVIAASELRPELGRKIATRYGIARIYTDHRELLEKESVDGIAPARSSPRSRSALVETLTPR